MVVDVNIHSEILRFIQMKTLEKTALFISYTDNSFHLSYFCFIKSQRILNAIIIFSLLNNIIIKAENIICFIKRNFKYCYPVFSTEIIATLYRFLSIINCDWSWLLRKYIGMIALAVSIDLDSEFYF